jgi:hypothetical protein
VNQELYQNASDFDVTSHYEKLKISQSDNQWRAINDINQLSKVAYNRDAIFYLLYNPWNITRLDPKLSVSSSRLGCRILSQDSIRTNAIGKRLLPHHLNSQFASANTEFAQFLLNALKCQAGIPIGDSDPGFDLILPGAIVGKRRLSEDRPLLDIRKCASIVLKIEGDLPSETV